MKREKVFEVSTSSLSEFRAVAPKLQSILDKKSVVAFSGDLGAGKTEMVRALCALENASGVSSPTFAIHQRYQGTNRSIDHLDLYRLKSESELDGTGFWDFFSEDSGWILIEWPEKMNLEHIPFSWKLYWIEIKKLSESQREIQVFQRNG